MIKKLLILLLSATLLLTGCGTRYEGPEDWRYSGYYLEDSILVDGNAKTIYIDRTDDTLMVYNNDSEQTVFFEKNLTEDMNDAAYALQNFWFEDTNDDFTYEFCAKDLIDGVEVIKVFKIDGNTLTYDQALTGGFLNKLYLASLQDLIGSSETASVNFSLSAPDDEYQFDDDGKVTVSSSGEVLLPENIDLKYFLGTWKCDTIDFDVFTIKEYGFWNYVDVFDEEHTDCIYRITGIGLVLFDEDNSITKIIRPIEGDKLDSTNGCTFSRQ